MLSLPSKELALLYEKLAQLQKGGVPILEGLPLATMQVGDPLLRKALLRVRASLLRGATLTEAFAACPEVFSGLQIALIGVGEAQGRLDQCLSELAALCENEYKVKKKLLSALAYPAFLLCAGVLLPAASIWYTQGFFAFLRSVLSTASLIMVPGLAGYLLWLALRKRAPDLLERVLLGVPIIGRLLRKMIFARFARSLGALLSAGVELRRGLELSISAMGNRYLEGRSRCVLTSIGKGEGLAQSLMEAEVFPAELVQRIAIGERAGQLDKTLSKAAEYYEFEAEGTLRSLIGALPVLIFLLVAVRVAFTVIGFYTGYLDNIDKIIADPNLSR